MSSAIPQQWIATGLNPSFDEPPLTGIEDNLRDHDKITEFDDSEEEDSD